jgi:uncharacterized protein (DUF362 family)
VNFASGTSADPKKHIVTDLRLLADVVENIVKTNPIATIYIAESDSTGYGFAYLKFEHLELPESLGLNDSGLDNVQLLDLSRDKLSKVESKQFKYFASPDRQLWLSQTLMTSDFIISLSNLKTHSVTAYTGACKNLFGCLPDFDKSIYHPHIHKVIHDVTLAVMPTLSIVDAFYSMERNGPCSGHDISLGYRVFSDNAVEADIQAALSVGIKPISVKYIRYLSDTTGYSARKESIKSHDNVIVLKKPQLFLRIMNFIGLAVQRIGQGISSFGHAIHTCNNPIVLVVTIMRPFLIRVFDMDKLKSMKKKFQKWY